MTMKSLIFVDSKEQPTEFRGIISGREFSAPRRCRASRNFTSYSRLRPLGIWKNHSVDGAPSRRSCSEIVSTHSVGLQIMQFFSPCMHNARFLFRQSWAIWKFPGPWRRSIFSVGRSTFSVGRTGAFHFFRGAFHFFPAEKRNEKWNGVSV